MLSSVDKMTTLLFRVCAAGVCLLPPMVAQFAPLCPGSQATPEIKQGMAAYQQRNYSEAAQHFQAATELDPSCANARLYLGLSYLNQFIPGADTPENQAMADAARGQFERVLGEQPQNEQAITSIASLYFNSKKLDDADVWYQKLIAVNPDNKEAFYTLGVITWARVFEPITKARVKIGMKPEDPGPLKDADVREALRVKYWTAIEEGMQNLSRAIDIDAEYDDAMAYMNLLYRQRADLQNSAEAYQADVAKADEWVQKALEARKFKAEHPH
jgi:Tfp pilus assembly protein PilF